MSGAIIRNTGQAVTLHLPGGDVLPAASVPEALDLLEQTRAGPPVRCPGCEPDTCKCMPHE